MTLLQIIYYFIVALGLFFILNYFNKLDIKTPSVIILIPIIYLFLISELPYLNKDLIYLVIPIEMLIRIYYTKSVLNQEEKIDKDYYIQTYGLSFILSYLLTEILLTKVNTILPTAEEIRIGIWFFTVLFLYKILNGKISFQLEKQEAKTLKIKEEAIVVKYARFKNQYSHLIKSKDKNRNLLVYAMMIYEDRNRSQFLRNLDRLHYRFTGKVMKMGIMQVETNKEITDEESIKIVLRNLDKIQKEMQSNKNSKKQNIHLEVLKEYYQEEEKVNTILTIYDTLDCFNQK